MYTSTVQVTRLSRSVFVTSAISLQFSTHPSSLDICTRARFSSSIPMLNTFDVFFLSLEYLLSVLDGLHDDISLLFHSRPNK
jgi:hypothetical protein